MADIIMFHDLPADVRKHELVALMIAGANAKASRVAPCLVSTTTPPTGDQLDEARLVLVGAVKRWADAGSGAFSQTTQTAGPFALGQSVDTRQRTGFNLWPSEIEALQDICKTVGSGGAFSIDTAPGSGLGMHADWCSLRLGATYCSCGADIAGVPIFEQA